MKPAIRVGGRTGTVHNPTVCEWGPSRSRGTVCGRGTPRLQSLEDVSPAVVAAMDSASAFLDLLGGELDRRILELADEQPRSAEDVAEQCDASLPTAYRHVDDLASAGLLTERPEYDAQGNHYNTYAAALEQATISVEAGELELTVSTVDDTAGSGLDESSNPESVEEAGTGAVEEIERPRSGT
jgi:DNA-binding transcriptional ArsR family regulator